MPVPSWYSAGSQSNSGEFNSVMGVGAPHMSVVDERVVA